MTEFIVPEDEIYDIAILIGENLQKMGWSIDGKVYTCENCDWAQESHDNYCRICGGKLILKEADDYDSLFFALKNALKNHKER